MQLITKSSSAGSATENLANRPTPTADGPIPGQAGQNGPLVANSAATTIEADYVGKHRPSKLSLRHHRVRVSDLANRLVASAAK
jgi:hypothetical protein